MDLFGVALILIFCTPLGWIGMLCFAAIIMAARVR